MVDEYLRKFPLSSLGRCKRETRSFIYPHPGDWYKDTSSGKYYFVLGKTIHVQRNDGFYSRWVSSGENKWVSSDNFLWLWDDNGRWYPSKEADRNRNEPSEYGNKFKIPLECIGTECPEQIRFPSNGIWSFDAGNVTFRPDGKDYRYELQSNGLFSKMRGVTKICPPNWTWNTKNTKWTPVDGDDKDCEGETEGENSDTQDEISKGICKLPKEIFKD